MKQKMTKLTSVLLAVIMLLSVFVVPVSAMGSFQDVPEGKWYTEAVEYVTQHGLMNGVGSGEFNPDGNVTRAMFVTVLARMAKAETDDSVVVFDDVPAGRWYTGAVAWAKENGIVNGLSSTCFGPTDSITRQDMCTIFARFVEKMGYDLPEGESKTFSDRSKIASYAKDAVAFCARVGLVNGFKDGSFRPKGLTTRAQVATIITRLDMTVNGTNPVPMPAQEFSGEAGEDMSISVNAPEGALPENTSMTVSRVNNSLISGTMEAASDMGTMVAAVDISFANEGEEIEPKTEVEVVLALAGLSELQNPQVYHLKDDGTVEHVETYSNTRGPKGNTLTFKAKDFSIYAILNEPVTGDERLTVRFKYTEYADENDTTGTDKEVTMVYVKSSDKVVSEDATTGETRDPLVEIMYDPGTGAYSFAEDELFAGWVPGVRDYTSETEYCATIEAVREYIRNMTWTNGQEIIFWARIMKVFTITYMENEVVSLGSDNVMRTRTETAKFYIVERDYVPATSDKSFEGWKATDETYQNIIGATSANTVYSKNEKIEVKGDVHMVVYCPQGFWISFNEKPDPVAHKGAKYVAPIFCSGGVLPSQATVDSTLAGYTFDGWYDPKVGWNDGAGKITNTNQITHASHFDDEGKLIENVNLQAHWTMNPTTSYTVVVWMQSAIDTSKYDYYTMQVLENQTSGAAIPVPDSSTYGTGISKTGFEYASNDAGSRTLAPDGSTVLNIYYNRVEVTYTFKVPTYTETTSANFSNTDQAYFVDYDEQKYQVETSGYFYVREQNPDTSQTYYVKDSSAGWTAVTYQFINYSVGYRWASSSGYYSANVALFTRHDAVNGDTVPAVSFSGNLSNNRTNHYWIYRNNSWVEIEYAGRGYNSSYYFWHIVGTSTVSNNSNSTSYSRSNNYIDEDYINPSSRYYTSSYSTSVTPPTSVTYPVYEFSWTDRETFTGVYGQKLTDAGYTWPTDYRWYNADYVYGSSTTFTSVEDVFGTSNNDNPEDEFHSDYYGQEQAYNTNVYHFLEKLEGGYEAAQDDATYTIPTVIGNGMVFRSFQGFTHSEFRLSLPSGVTSYTTGTSYNGDNLVNPVSHTTSTGWTDWFPYGTGVEYEGNTRHETTRWAVQANGIEFRYSRNTYDLTYMNGSTPLKTETGIKYEATLGDYKNYTPEGTGGAVFAGWYKDAAFTQEFDFDNEKMPVGGVTVYGKFQVPQYRIYVYPNINPDDPRDGCWNWNHKPNGESVTWNDTYQSMCFRIDAGLISGGQMLQPDRGAGIDLVGWYTDPDFQHPFDFSTEVNDSTTTEYDKTDPDLKTDFETQDPIIDENGISHDNPKRDANGNLNWNQNKDGSRTWITRKLQLYARWRYNIPGALGINVEYATTNGTEYVTTAVTDSKVYTDAADAIAYPCDNKLPAGHEQDGTRFMYWIVQTINAETGEYEDKLDDKGEKVIVYPGGTFSVELADAKQKLRDDYVEGESLEIEKYTYTVRLRAFYKNPKQEKATHVIWVGNGGTCEVNGETREFLYSQDTQINAPIPIELDFFTNPGHVFLGWARLTEESCGVEYDQDGNLIKFNERGDLTDANLWLEFYPADDTHSTGYFKVKNDADNVNGREVTHIAADEDAPYHIMYAVWSQSTYYYVYHSSNGELEAREILDTRAEDTVDLSLLVKDGYLYGGHYDSYGGIITENLLQAEYNAPYTTSKSFIVPDAINYDGSAIRCTVTEHGEQVTRRFWSRASASRDSYIVTPETGDVFYLKEVPQSFLPNRIVMTKDYHTGKYVDAYMLTAVDDTMYDYSGMLINGQQIAKKSIVVAKTFEISSKDWVDSQGKPIVLTVSAHDLNSEIPEGGGYVVVYNLTGTFLNGAAGGTFTVDPEWVTYDGYTAKQNSLIYEVKSDKTDIKWYAGKLYADFGTGDESWWTDDEPIFRARFFTEDEGGNVKDAWKQFSLVSDNTYEVEVPGGNWEKLILVRCDPNGTFDETDPDWDEFRWSQTGNINMSGYENGNKNYIQYVYKSLGGDITWQKYTPSN